jgi:uncharacterized HAD superfamily protein
MKVFDTSQSIDFIRGEGHWHGDHFHEGGVEPHIWNSTINATVIADNIYQALCQLDSVNQTYYQIRTDSLKRSIAETDKKIRSLLHDADSTFLIYHPALSYYARDYGLQQISIEEEGKEPSPFNLKEIIKICQKECVRVIFVQQEFDQRNAQLIASELGIQIVPINPLGYDWTEEMINDFSSKKRTYISETCNFMPGVVEVINLLKKDGHELIIITARGDEYQEKSIAQKRFEEKALEFDKYYWGAHNKSEICKEENIDLYILSSVNFSDGKLGKLNWIKKHTDIDRHHIIITNLGKEKEYYADQTSILIDDFRKNCEAFANGGGQFVKYETPRQTKEDLLNLLSKT